MLFFSSFYKALLNRHSWIFSIILIAILFTAFYALVAFYDLTWPKKIWTVQLILNDITHYWSRNFDNFLAWSSWIFLVFIVILWFWVFFKLVIACFWWIPWSLQRPINSPEMGVPASLNSLILWWTEGTGNRISWFFSGIYVFFKFLIFLPANFLYWVSSKSRPWRYRIGFFFFFIYSVVLFFFKLFFFTFFSCLLLFFFFLILVNYFKTLSIESKETYIFFEFGLFFLSEFVLFLAKICKLNDVVLFQLIPIKTTWVNAETAELHHFQLESFSGHLVYQNIVHIQYCSFESWVLIFKVLFFFFFSGFNFFYTFLFTFESLTLKEIIEILHLENMEDIYVHPEIQKFPYYFGINFLTNPIVDHLARLFAMNVYFFYYFFAVFYKIFFWFLFIHFYLVRKGALIYFLFSKGSPKSSLIFFLMTCFAIASASNHALSIEDIIHELSFSVLLYYSVDWYLLALYVLSFFFHYCSQGFLLSIGSYFVTHTRRFYKSWFFFPLQFWLVIIFFFYFFLVLAVFEFCRFFLGLIFFVFRYFFIIVGFFHVGISF